MVILSGSELVLVAQVPRASNRWKQVHINRDIAERFFRVTPGQRLQVSLEHIGPSGEVLSRTDRSLVFAERNRNCKLEFSFGSVTDYPDGGPPILVVFEVDIRKFRYVALFPGNPGYEEMFSLNAARPAIGRGARRVLTNLDEVELRWPDCRLRGAN